MPRVQACTYARTFALLVFLPPSLLLTVMPLCCCVVVDRVGVVGIQGVWLPRYAGQHCQLSDPLKIPEPCFDASTGTVQCHRTAMYGKT